MNERDDGIDGDDEDAEARRLGRKYGRYDRWMAYLARTISFDIPTTIIKSEKMEFFKAHRWWWRHLDDAFAHANQQERKLGEEEGRGIPDYMEGYDDEQFERTWQVIYSRSAFMHELLLRDAGLILEWRVRLKDGSLKMRRDSYPYSAPWPLLDESDQDDLKEKWPYENWWSKAPMPTVWGSSQSRSIPNHEYFHFDPSGQSSFTEAFAMRLNLKCPDIEILKDVQRKAKQFLEMRRKESEVPNPGKKSYHLPHSDDQPFEFFEKRGEPRPSPQALSSGIDPATWCLLEKMDMGDRSNSVRKSVSKWRKIAQEGYLEAPP